MGTPLAEPEGLTAEYMLGLLGYSTWNLYRDRVFVGQVTLNAVDQSAVFTQDLDEFWVAEMFMFQPWRWWMNWLRNHRHEPF